MQQQGGIKDHQVIFLPLTLTNKMEACHQGGIVVTEMMEDPFIAKDDTHRCHKVEDHVAYCCEVKLEAKDAD